VLVRRLRSTLELVGTLQKSGNDHGSSVAKETALK